MKERIKKMDKLVIVLIAIASLLLIVFILTHFINTNKNDDKKNINKNTKEIRNDIIEEKDSDVKKDFDGSYNGTILEFPLDINIFLNDGWTAIENEEEVYYINDKYDNIKLFFYDDISNNDPDNYLENGIYMYSFEISSKVSKYPDMSFNGISFKELSADKIMDSYGEEVCKLNNVSPEYKKIKCIVKNNKQNYFITFKFKDGLLSTLIVSR